MGEGSGDCGELSRTVAWTQQAERRQLVNSRRSIIPESSHLKDCYAS